MTCLHQIDFCQLLNKDSFFKYERNGNLVGLKEIFDQTKLFKTPGPAKLHLVDWVIFNYLIGNADAHAKNLSAQVTPQGLELAPFYDLLSVVPYGDERLAPELEVALVEGISNCIGRFVGHAMDALR